MMKRSEKIARTLAVAAVAAFAVPMAAPVEAAVYVTSNAAGGGLIRYDESGPTTFTEPGGNSAGERRVGNSSMPTDTLNSVYFFELPEFDDFNEQVSGGASGTSMSFFYAQQDNAPNFNVDVYGLGYTATPTMDGDWFFEGANDTTARSTIGTGSTGTVSKVAEDALVTGVTPLGRVSANGVAVREYLASLYADGAQAGDYAVFRLNADAISNDVNGPNTGFDVVHTTSGSHGAGDLARVTIRPDVVAHDTFAGAPTGSLQGVATGSGLNTGTGWVVPTNGDPAASVVNPGSELSHSTAGGTINGGSTAAQFTGAYDGSTGQNNNPMRRALATPFTGNDLYFRYMVQKTDANMDSNDFVVMWLDNSGLGSNGDEHASSSAFLGIRGEDLAFARLYGSSLSEEVNTSTGGTTAGETYTLVGHLFRADPDAGDGFNRLAFWLNPDSFDLDTPDGMIAFPGQNLSLTSINAIGFRTGQFTELTDQFIVDGIVLGETWASVVPIVPEPTSAALLGVAALLTARRRRRT